MIGAGVLSFPKLMMKCGIPLGSALMAVCCALSIYLSISLSEAIGDVQERTGGSVQKLDDMGLACFGPVGKMAASLFVNGLFVGRLSTYVVLIGKNLYYLCELLPYKTWVLLVSVFLVPSAFLRDVKAVRSSLASA